MTITVLVFTDGRKECIHRTLASFAQAWPGEPDRKIIINDAADEAYAQWLDGNFADWERVHHDRRRGFGGAIQSGWSQVETDWVFHLEDDFLFQERLDPTGMIEILQYRGPSLIQLALKRQPWNSEEAAAGDLMLVHPEAWDCQSLPKGSATVRWSEQRLFFTTNPSIYRREITEIGWPQVQHSEGIFSHLLMKDPDVRFGMLGWPTDRPKVWHIGDQRVGTGY